MTKLTYAIKYHGKTVKTVNTMKEAVEAVKTLGDGWSYVKVYTEFDPDNTTEYQAECKKHAEKVEAKRTERKAHTM